MSADTPRDADAAPPHGAGHERAGHERAAEPEQARAAERETARPPADAGRSPHLNRAEYNAVRHAEPPIQRQADAPPPAAGGSHDRRTERAAPGQPYETATPGPREAQALNRAEYNAARHAEPPIRGLDAAAGQGRDQASRDQAGGQPAITHYYADFKGQRTDLYTDGDRWASGDQARDNAAAGRGELPDDSPTGEDLVDSADEEGSLAERFRREAYEEFDEISDVVEHGTNRAYDLLAPPPTFSYEAHPIAGPHFSAPQPNGMDVGTGAAALFALGVTVDRVAKWTMGHFEKHQKGD